MLKNIKHKLHFLDYLIILSVLLGGILLYKFFNPEKKWVEVVIFTQNSSIFQASGFRPNDFEVDSSGKKIAIIEDVQAYDSQLESTVQNANQNILIKTKILFEINSRTGEYMYKNKIIKVSSPIELSFNSGYVIGSVLQMEGINLSATTQTKILTLKLYNRWPWLAENLKVGQGEKIYSNGQKIIEIISQESIPAEITTTNQNGETFLKSDPRKVDITLKVKVTAKRFKDKLILRKNTSLNTGDLISFNADNIRVTDALISNIE